MDHPLINLMAGYQPFPVMLPTPKRQSFAVRRFEGLAGAVKLLWKARRNPSAIKAEREYNEAIRAHSIGRFKEAERHYINCIKLQRDHEPAHTNLAALYIERSTYDLALEELEKCLAYRPDYFRGYYNMGLLYYVLGRRTDAVEKLQESLKLKPDHFWSHVMLGEIHAKRDEYERAMQHYQSALEQTTSPMPIYVRMADFHIRCNSYKEGEECLRKALEIKDLPELKYNLAWIIAAQNGNLDEVVKLLSQAEKGKPDFEQALFNLSLAQSLNGQTIQSVESMSQYFLNYVKKEHKEMVRYMEYLVEVNPHNYPAMLKTAGLYLDLERTEDAVQLLKKTLQFKPNYTAAVEKLAEVYRNMGRHKDAVTTYRALIKYEPNNVRGYLGLTRAYGAIGNYAAATPVIKKVLELDPNNTELHYQYGTLMAQENKLSLAYKHYRIVANLDPNFPRINKRLKMLEEEMEEQASESDSPWPVVKRPPPTDD